MDQLRHNDGGDDNDYTGWAGELSLYRKNEEQGMVPHPQREKDIKARLRDEAIVVVSTLSLELRIETKQADYRKHNRLDTGGREKRTYCLIYLVYVWDL